MGAWLAVFALFPRTALADDLREFEAARALYDRQGYAAAVDALRALVGTDPPRVADPLLVVESRKYLAASLLFMGAAEDAKAQFKLLLTQEPDYALDPLAFPTEVLALFEKVKADLQRELDAKRHAEQAARLESERKQLESDRLRRQNLARLAALAGQAEHRDRASRWVASIPFGVGQFQNGHKGLGVALAMAESLAAATSAVSFIGHQRMADDRPSPAEADDAQHTESIWRNTNYISFGIFAGLVLVGVVDAHVRFVSERVTPHRRPLPPDLERWTREQGLSAGGPVLRF